MDSSKGSQTGDTQAESTSEVQVNILHVPVSQSNAEDNNNAMDLTLADISQLKSRYPEYSGCDVRLIIVLITLVWWRFGVLILGLSLGCVSWFRREYGSLGLLNLADFHLNCFRKQGTSKDFELATSYYLSVLSQYSLGDPLSASTLFGISQALSARFNQRGDFQDLAVWVKYSHSAFNLCFPEHPHRFLMQWHLATSLLKRFEQRRDLQDLEMAITHFNGALEGSPTEHIAHSVSQNDLGCALLTRFQQRGDFRDLELAIEHHGYALQLRPPGHPDRPLSLINLANALFTRFLQRGDSKDLELSIDYYSTVSDLQLVGHPAHLASQTNLASALLERFRQRGDPEDLDLAIKYNRCALELLPVGHPERSSPQSKLGNALSTRYSQQGKSQDLQSAIEHYNDALQLHLPENPARFEPHNGLGNALILRYQKSGDVQDVELAIMHYNCAMKLRPPGHIGRSQLQVNLGNALLTRFQLRGDIKDLEVAIGHYDYVLNLLPSKHTLRPQLQINLGNALRTKFSHQGDSRDLELSIYHYSGALELCPPGHTSRSLSQINLAAALRARFEHFGDPQDLELAIHHNTVALESCPPGLRSSSLTHLSIALRIRFEQQANINDLELAIQHLDSALELRPVGHPHRLGSQTQLANALLKRFEQRGEMKDLELAIEHHRDALEQSPSGHLFRSISQNNLASALLMRFEQSSDLRDMSQNNLANALMVRFERRGNVQDLELAVEYHTSALELRSSGHPERWSSQIGLASALLRRFKQQRNLQDLTLAIEHYSSGLDACSIDHPQRSQSLVKLAEALLVRFQQTKDSGDLATAFFYVDDVLHRLPAGHPSRYHVYRCLSKIYHAQFLAYEELSSNEQIFHYHILASNHIPAGSLHQLTAALEWVSDAEGFNHESTLSAYKTSLNLLDRHIMAMSNVRSRYDLLKYVPVSLPTDAASCAIRNGQLDVAVELLEQGRGLLWTQLARFRTPLDHLRLLDGDGLRLANEFERISDLLQQADNTITPQNSNMASLEEHARHYRKLSEEWETVIEEIRQMKGFAHFLLPTPYEELQRSAIHGPVIIVNISMYSCDVIIIRISGEPHVVHLPQLTWEDVSKLSSQLAYDLENTASNGEERQRERRIADILRQLWALVVSPVVQELQLIEDVVPKGSRIWWCPTSKLTSLPLHAAGPYRLGQLNLSNIFISSYTPTLSALIRSREGAIRHRSMTRNFVAIGQAKPWEGSSDRDLQAVDVELELVKDLVSPSMPCSQLTGDGATAEGVLQSIREHDWIHLACHGQQDMSQPFDSRFDLRNKPLRLADLIQADLEHPEFAFLSACHTAAGDQMSPDEVIHLAAGMQFSGFRSVIGTLWAVDDKTARHMVYEFYKNLFNGETDCRQAAKALNKAMKTVDKRTVPLDQRIVFIHIGA